MPKSLTIDYQQLFNSLPGPVLLLDTDAPDFTILAENQAHADIAMMPLNKAVGMKFLDAYPDTSEKFKKTGVSDLRESFVKVLKTKQQDSMDDLRYDLKGPDGTIEQRYWRTTHYPIFGNDGEILYILQHAENVTDEVRTKRKLNEARLQLDEALAIGLIGTWLWDLKDDYVVADKNLLRLFGISPEEAVDGLPLEDFTKSIYIEDRPRVTADIEKAVAEATSFEAEYRTVSRTGEVRWVIARGRVERDDDGKPVRFPGVIVDITERKMAELNLQFLTDASVVLSSSLDYEKTLQALTELAIPGLADWCTIDMLDGGKIKLVALAHKDPKKMVWAQELREANPPRLDDPAGMPYVLRTGESAFYPVIDDKMLQAAAVTEEERKLIRSLELSSSIVVPLKDGDKTIGALTLISTGGKRQYNEADLHLAEAVANRASLAISNADLYQRAQDELEARAILEEQLRDANDLLEKRVQKRTEKLQELNTELNRSNQELQDFAYVASHDLQEPLRKIQAFGNLLEQEYGKQLGDGHDYLKRMQGAAARMSSLISDLLAFSRVSTKTQPFVPVDLTVIARDVVSDLEARIAETEGKVTVGQLPTIEADPVQMRQLFQNLIGNALKFHREGVPPVVTVEAKPVNEGGEVCTALVVTDNGVGFDMKYTDRIFAVFQRLHDRNQYEGTGIGLAVCRKIIERHGGSIAADSRPGKGTSFIVTLPCSAGRKKSNKQSEQSKEPKPNTKEEAVS